MKRWNAIPIITVIMMLTLMVAPVCSEDTEAATGDVILYSNTSELELKSGSSSVIQVIISNTTGNTYDIKMTSSHDNGDYKISYDVSEFILEADGIQTVNVTLKTEKYSERADDILTIGVECFSFDSTPVTVNTISIDVSTYSVYNNEESFNNILGIFKNPFPAPFDSPLSTAIITLLIWMVLGTVLSIVAVILIYHMIFRRDKTNVGDARVRLNQMRKFIFGIIMLYGLANSMNVYGLDVGLVGKFTELSEFLFVIFGGIIVWKIVRVEIEAMGRRLGENGRFDPSIIPLFLMIAKIIVTLVTISIALAVYGVDFVAIITGLGLLTTGLSLGAKNIINQFLSGVVLLIERPFVKSDKIKLSTDKTTTLVVEKVGYMTTRFKNWSNEEMVVVPNNAITSGTMTNMTRDNVLYRVYDYYSISYESDIAKAKEIIMGVALENPDVICDPMMQSPDVTFDNTDRNAINLRISFIVNDHENYGGIAGRIRYEIFNRLCAAGVDIPYDQYTINLVRLKRTDDEAEPSA